MNGFQINEVKSTSGKPNVQIVFEGKMVTLHSVAPEKEAERAAAKFNSKLSWVVLAGFGLGYLAEHLLQNTNYNVIVYEHTPEILAYAENVRNLDPVLNNKRLFRIEGESSRLIDFLEANYIKELNFYIHRPYLTLFPEVYSNLEGLLIAYLSKKQMNKATLKRFQKVWLRNIIRNSKYYFSIPGIRDIKHSFRGKPAVIVGAGPSLGKNIKMLQEHQDEFAVISTDTALSILCENGIKPDFTVTVDPQEKNTFYLLYSKYKDSPLIMDSAASFLSLKGYGLDKVIFFDTVFPLYETMREYWGEKGGLLCGGSVSTTAFDFARFLGADPIVFIGQDLAYSKKETHVRGSILEDFLYYKINRFHTYENYNSKMLLFSDRIEVDGWNNQKVQTDRKFITFLEWFKREIAETEAQVINATEGGALMSGAQHIPFQDVVKNHSKGKLDKHLVKDNEKKEDKSFTEFLNKVKSEIESLIPLGLKASRSATQLRMNNNSTQQHLFEDMNQFDRAVLLSVKRGGNIARFIEFTMQESIEKILEGIDSSELTEEVISNWKEFYQEAYEGLLQIRHLLNKRLV